MFTLELSSASSRLKHHRLWRYPADVDSSDNEDAGRAVAVLAAAPLIPVVIYATPAPEIVKGHSEDGRMNGRFTYERMRLALRAKSV